MSLTTTRLATILDEVEKRFGTILGNKWEATVAKTTDGNLENDIRLWNGSDDYKLSCDDAKCSLSKISFIPSPSKREGGVQFLWGCAYNSGLDEEGDVREDVIGTFLIKDILTKDGEDRTDIPKDNVVDNAGADTQGPDSTNVGNDTIPYDDINYSCEEHVGSASTACCGQNCYRDTEDISSFDIEATEEAKIDVPVEMVIPPCEEWERILPYGLSSGATAIKQTLDGGFILAAGTIIIMPNQDILLIKTNFLGIEEWNNIFDGANAEAVFGVQQTTDLGFVLSGRRYIDPQNDGDFLLLKTDSDGKAMWEKTLGYGFGSSDDAYFVQQTIGGGYFLGGTGVEVNNGTFAGMLLAKTDEEGTTEWLKLYGEGTGTAAQSWAGQQTDDGNYVAAGYFTPNTGADPSTTDFQDAQLLKVDDQGNELWKRTYPEDVDPDEESFFGVQQTLDGGFIAAGFKFYAPFVIGGFDIYLVKTDPDGFEEWSSVFGGDGYEDARFVQQTDDGGFIVGGVQGTGVPTSYHHTILIKTDDQGVEEWTKILGADVGGCALAGQQTSDGGYILAGNTDCYCNTANCNDVPNVWLKKVCPQ